MSDKKNLDAIYNTVVNSKKRIKEARSHLNSSLDKIAKSNQELIKLSYKAQILKTIEGLNDLVLAITQQVENGMFFQAMQVYRKAAKRFNALDESIRSTGLVSRLGDVILGKKIEIKHLCEYFLIDQIFNTEVLTNNQELLEQIDFGQVVFNLIDNFGSSPESQTAAKTIELEENPRSKRKLFGKKRINFLYSIVKKMEGFDADSFMQFIDFAKIDSVIDVMFDGEIVKVFKELDKKGTSLTQADDEANYYNIFLSVQCLKELDPDLVIPELLVTNLDENFNRVILNCFNSFIQDIFILDINCKKISSSPLPYFFWQSEFVRGLLPESFLVSKITNLESLCKLFVLLTFFGLQYLADFIKMCLFLDDQTSIKNHIG